MKENPFNYRTLVVIAMTGNIVDFVYSKQLTKNVKSIISVYFSTFRV